MQVESFWASHHPTSLQVDLFGSKAGATLQPLALYRTVNGAPQDIKVDLPDGPTGLENIAKHFISCILDGAECRAPLRHGLIVQQMMEGLLESACTGRQVRFD